MSSVKLNTTGGSGGSVALKGPASTTSNADVELTLPVDDGTANQYLKTDGSGALSWSTVSTTDSSKVAKTGDTMTGELTIDTTATASTVCQTLKAPQNDRLNVWKNNDNGGGSWYATGGASNAIDLQWNSYSAQVIKFKNAGDVEVLTGNLKISTSGKGIDFSANTDAGGTSTATVLDDYEQGTWVPDFEYLTVDAGASSGSYIKVGNLCWITCFVKADGAGTANSAIRITGLPYNRESGHDIYFSPFTTKVDTDEGGFGPVIHGYSYGSDKIIFERQNASETGSNDYVKATHCGDDCGFHCTFVYRTT